MEVFDFQKGGTVGGVFFPPLKRLRDVRGAGGDCQFYVYEPGNMTRYEVFICHRWRFHDDQWLPEAAITITNFGRPCSMQIGKKWDFYDLEYVAEKMGIQIGDTYALMPLVNKYVDDHHLFLPKDYIPF